MIIKIIRLSNKTKNNNCSHLSKEKIKIMNILKSKYKKKKKNLNKVKIKKI